MNASLNFSETISLKKASWMSIGAKARLAGLLYLLIIATGLFSEFFVRSALIVSGDAAATAANILASEPLYRLGGSAGFVTLICDIAIAALFFEIFRPASATLSLAAAFFRLVFGAMMGVVTLLHFAPLILLSGASYLGGLSDGDLQSLSLLSLNLHAAGFSAALIFFGVHCLLVGLLILRSGIVPRLIGLLIAAAGICYLVNSFAGFLAPEFARTLFPFILLPPLVGEASLALWLSLRGANERIWRSRLETRS